MNMNPDVVTIGFPLVMATSTMLGCLWLLRTYSDRFHRALAAGLCFSTWFVLGASLVRMADKDSPGPAMVRHQSAVLSVMTEESAGAFHEN